MAQTLIVYGTRLGSTAKTADVIAEVLKEKYSHYVTVADVKQVKKMGIDPAHHDNIIIGSSIMAGKWTGRLKKYLKKQDLNDRRLALFITSGGVMNRVLLGTATREEAVEYALANFAEPIVSELGLKPISQTAFGGRMVFFGKEKYNSWNKADIEAWAVELGKLFKA